MGWSFKCYGMSCAAVKVNLPPHKVAELYALRDDERGFVEDTSHGEFCFSLPENCIWVKTEQSDIAGFETKGSPSNTKMHQFFSEVAHKSHLYGIQRTWRINVGITIYKHEDLVFEFKSLNRLAAAIEKDGTCVWSEPEYAEWFEKLTAAFSCGYRDGVVCVEWV